jgi:hypothetical protein
MSEPHLAAGMPFPNREEVTTMLRVSYSDAANEQRWSLCGRLAGPWVDELRSCWRQARERAPRAHAVVDLKEVVFIDEAGERLLAEMEISGAQLVAAGVENQHVIASLRKPAGCSLRRRLEDLCERRREGATKNGEGK